MSALRPEVSIHTLNEAGGEYLPGYLGIEMLALDERRLNSRMPVKKLHAAPNEFLHAASVVALASSVTVASHTWVVRPRCWAVALHAIAPSRTVPRWLLLSSMVVKPLAPAGSVAMQP